MGDAIAIGRVHNTLRQERCPTDFSIESFLDGKPGASDDGR